MFQLGSISTGTLRTEDLLLAFAKKLDRLNTKSEAGCEWLFNEAYRLARSNRATQQECDDRLQDLQDALNEFCPPFVYFGTHPGDGADFGFWVDHDAIDEIQRTINPFVKSFGYEYVLDTIILLSNHGNITVMDLDRKELWSTV